MSALVRSGNITTATVDQLGLGGHDYSDADVDNISIIMPVVSRQVGIRLRNLPGGGVSDRQWQGWREAGRQIEVLELWSGRLGGRQGREVGRWCGKVGRVTIRSVEFDDFGAFIEAVVQAVGEVGSMCDLITFRKSGEREEVVGLGGKMGWIVKDEKSEIFGGFEIVISKK